MAGPRPYEQSHSSGKRFPGQMLLKPRSKLMHYGMSYSKGKTLFRPWGDLRADGTMAPWRDNEGHFGVSWFVQDDVCQAWGKDFKFTAFTRCEDEANWPTGSPLQLLFDEVKYSQKFKSMLERVGNSWPIISPPRHSGLLKGLLIEMNGKSYAQKPLWGTMLVISPSAREALDELLNLQADAKQPAQASADDPYGWNTKYYVGDPIGLQCGKIFEFDKESNIFGSEASEIDIAADGRATSNKSDSPIEKYACRIYEKKPVLSLPVDKVKKYDESFVDALWFMTGEEQINNLLIRGFGHSHRDLLLYVFGNKGVLPAAYEFGKTTVDMGKPAAGPTSTAPQGAPSTEPEINLDADQGGDEEPPFEPNVNAAAQPVFTPKADGFTPPTAAAKPATMSTADSIRQRLAAASNKGQAPAQPQA